MNVDSSRLLALFSATDLDALIDAAFRIIRGAVPCDFASAFYRYSDKGLLKERDSRGREYPPDFTRRYIELSPAIPIARAKPGINLISTRGVLPDSDRELAKSEFHREIMQVQGWRHAVAMCFWSDPPAELPVFVASVNRRHGRPDFSRSDLAALRNIYPFISCAVNRLHELEAARSVRDGIAMTVRRGARGVVVLDWNLCLVEANPVARRFCASWGDTTARSRTPRARRNWRLPAALANACRDLRDDRISPGPISHPYLLGVTASISMICHSETGLSDPSFVIELEKIEKPDHQSLLLQKMTAAEGAAALALADGLSNQEVADELGKSVQAVKFLLHRIYEKTGLANRAALVAALRTGNTQLREHL
jgi:DNA-binding CsgD family transcriptional regulator